MKMILPPKIEMTVSAHHKIYICHVTFSHMRCSCLSEEERSLDVDCEMLVVKLLVNISNHPSSHNAGIQDQDIDFSKGLQSLFDNFLAAGDFGDVGFDGDSRVWS